MLDQRVRKYRRQRLCGANIVGMAHRGDGFDVGVKPDDQVGNAVHNRIADSGLELRNRVNQKVALVVHKRTPIAVSHNILATSNMRHHQGKRGDILLGERAVHRAALRQFGAQLLKLSVLLTEQSAESLEARIRARQDACDSIEAYQRNPPALRGLARRVLRLKVFNDLCAVRHAPLCDTLHREPTSAHELGTHRLHLGLEVLLAPKVCD